MTQMRLSTNLFDSPRTCTNYKTQKLHLRYTNHKTLLCNSSSNYAVLFEFQFMWYASFQVDQINTHKDSR